MTMEYTRIICGVFQILVSGGGIGINGYVFLMLRHPRYNGAFHCFCSFKSICNIILLLAAFLWSGPVTLLNYYFLPSFANVFAGQLLSALFFGMGPPISFCMTVNRFMAAFFPLKFRNSRGNAVKVLGIAFCFAVVLPLSLNGIIQEDCAYLYDLATLSWTVLTECAADNNYMLLYEIEILTAISTFMNILTFFKIMQVMRAIPNDCSSLMREKKSRRMLIQSFVQDILYLADMLGGIYALSWSSATWWQFIVNSAIWQIHIALDGCIMYWYSRERKPSQRATIIVNPSSC